MPTWMSKWRLGGLKGEANTGRITNVVGAERAMLQLIMKSKKWQQSPLLGYQVHISNQLGDLTSTLADFLFHPEGFSYYWYQNCVHVQFFGLLTVSIRTMFLNICCAQKASYASPTILPLTKWVSSSWGMRYLKVVLLLLEFNGINNIFSLPLQLIEIDTFMNGDKYAKLQNLILKGAPAGSLLMFFPDSLDHDCKVQQLNSSFQGRGKIGFHLCCWNKK